MDIARIGLEADSRPIERASHELDEFTGASRRAEAANDERARSHRSAAAAANVTTTATKANTAAMHALAASSRMAAFRQRQLAVQSLDVAQSLALGMPPMMVAIQQGGQIAGLYAGQGGVTGAFREATQSVLGFARAHPVAIATTVVLTLATFGLRNEIEATTGESVTLGQVFVATMQELLASVNGVAAPAINALGSVFSGVANSILDGIRIVGNSIINTFTFAYDAVIALFRSLPMALAEMAIDGVNAIISSVNPLLEGLGLPAISLGNPFQGFGEDLSADLSAAYSVFENDPIGDFIGRVAERAGELARETDEATGSLNRFQTAVLSIQRATEDLWAQGNFFGEENRYDLLEYQKTQELLNAAMDAGVRITDAVRERISDLASDYVSAVQNLDLLREAQERFTAVVDFTKKTFSSFFSDFSNQIQQGASVWDAFKTAGLNALNSILSKVLEMASNNLVMSLFGGGSMGGGGGLLGGLLGSFGGFFAGGGVLGAGQWGIAGERGPEPIVGPARIISNDNYMRSANSNAPQPVVITQTNYINNPFGMEGVARAIQEGNARAVGQATNASVAKVSNIQRRTGRPLG